MTGTQTSPALYSLLVPSHSQREMESSLQVLDIKETEEVYDRPDSMQLSTNLKDQGDGGI